MQVHRDVAAFFILLYFELVRGNQSAGMPLRISLCTVLCIFSGEDQPPPLPLMFGARAAVGALWSVRWQGCSMLFSVQTGCAQTCGEPCGLCATCLGRLIYSPLPRIQTLGHGTPSRSCLNRMLHQEKKKHPEQGSGSFRIKLVQLHWKPLPLQGKKTTNAEKPESALASHFYRSKMGTSVILPLPPHPSTCHGSNILVTPFGFLIYCQVSPVHNDLRGLRSVLTK